MTLLECFERLVAYVEKTERENARSPSVDYDCRVFIREYGQKLLQALRASSGVVGAWRYRCVVEGVEVEHWSDWIVVPHDPTAELAGSTFQVQPLYTSPLPTPGEWHDGEPPKPFRDEWFIAMTVYGDRVVLRSLPEEWAYDYKTADDTYIMSKNIKKWMQFPDSQFKPYASPLPTVEVTEEMVERAAKAMWKASVPPSEEAKFPDHPCIARNLYLKSAYAALTAALSQDKGEE